jgi:hypothetical protein
MTKPNMIYVAESIDINYSTLDSTINKLKEKRKELAALGIQPEDIMLSIFERHECIIVEISYSRERTPKEILLEKEQSLKLKEQRKEQYLKLKKEFEGEKQ